MSSCQRAVAQIDLDCFQLECSLVLIGDGVSMFTFLAGSFCKGVADRFLFRCGGGGRGGGESGESGESVESGESGESGTI